MSEFGLFEAKNRFSELVGRAQAGEEVVVTKYGRPAARIIAYQAADGVEERRTRHRDSLRRIRALRARIVHPPTLEDIIAAKHDGHRF